MRATLASLKTVSVHGLKSIWKIPESDVVCADGFEFVKLRPHCFQLVSLVTEKNDEVTTSPRTLTGSIGLNAIIRIRNEAQVQELGGDSENKCTLFDGIQDEAQKPTKKQKMSAIEEGMVREQVSAMTIEFEVNGDMKQIRVLRPIRARDVLTIEFEQETVEHVLEYIRSAGFNDPKKHARKTVPDFPTGMKGVYARGDKWVAICHFPCGKKQYKTAATLEDAANLQARAEAGEALDDAADTEGPSELQANVTDPS